MTDRALRGTRIDVIAPSGAVLSREAFDRSLARMRACGWQVRERIAAQPWQRFSDTDAGRLETLHATAQAHDVDVVMIARGGYGLTRLLDRIDWKLIAASIGRGVKWVGFSDFTVLQLGLLARTGACTWAGPAVAGDFNGAALDTFTFEQFCALLGGQTPVIAWTGELVRPDDGSTLPSDRPDVLTQPIEGVLWGGNLAMVTSLVGTRWLPQVEGGLLFLEDVAEHPYRVERMLLQLLYAGVLTRQRALILGAFTEWREAPHDNGYGLDEVARHIAARAGIPVITGLPFGHQRRKAVLGVGLRYSLTSPLPGAFQLEAIPGLGSAPVGIDSGGADDGSVPTPGPASARRASPSNSRRSGSTRR